MGATAIQVHPTPPHYWGSPKLDEDRIARFKAAAEEAGRPPFFFHAVYLINLAGDDPLLRQRSESTLTGYLRAADEVDDPRVRACFDTCHAFASGYDERSAETARATVDEWDRVVGLENLVAVHCNDSLAGLGSNRDRHANIGQGEIGEEGFRTLLHDPRLADKPFILEVPGFQGKGPDAANMEILRRLAG
jgi:deoxyribonuclease-4